MRGRGGLARGLAVLCVLSSASACTEGERGGGERPRVDPGASAPPLVRFEPELRSAMRAFEERRYDEGRALVKSHLTGHPEDPQAQFLLGMSFYWTGNYGAARPWLERALAREPDLFAAREALGFSLLLLGELDGARREYETYVAAVPGDPKGHYGLGLIELEETHLDAAAERFRRAIALFEALEKKDPSAVAARQAEYAECHARLGEVHFARSEYAAARERLLRATAICPGNISAFYTLSLVHRRLGEEGLADQAAARFEDARQKLLAEQKSR